MDANDVVTITLPGPLVRQLLRVGRIAHDQSMGLAMLSYATDCRKLADAADEWAAFWPALAGGRRDEWAAFWPALAGGRRDEWEAIGDLLDRVQEWADAAERRGETIADPDYDGPREVESGAPRDPALEAAQDEDRP